MVILQYVLNVSQTIEYNLLLVSILLFVPTIQNLKAIYDLMVLILLALNNVGSLVNVITLIKRIKIY